jgi:peptide/nickel transport system substrate-binding protein
MAAAYDSLVTMAPGDYTQVKPGLATAWSRTPDGRGWRFTLRKGVRFATGNPVTAEDVKFSLDRVIAVGDQPSQYLSNVDAIRIVDDGTVDILLKQPSEPILSILSAPNFGVLEKQVVVQHGALDTPNARSDDKATDWLNTHSAGSGAYTITGWARNAQVQLVRNPYYWRGTPAYARVVIRHMPDGGEQLLAVQRGDIDAAFNLIPEQIATLHGDPHVRTERLTSLDFVYLAITQDPALNPALAVKQARQAIGYAIDYDGIKTSMLGGAATRPASFLPVGMPGSTEAVTREIGFREDLPRARALLQQGGYPDGFAFDLLFGTGAIAGVTYQALGQKLQSDLARVGIRARLVPTTSVSLRAQYEAAKIPVGMTFWNPPAVENELWAAATVERVARRTAWKPPQELIALVHRAAGEADPERQKALWLEYQKAMVDQGSLIVLFQPIYQIAVRDTVKTFPLTAAGWQVELHDAAPA